MSDILKWNSAVGDGNSSQTDSNDDLVESKNKVVKFIFLEDFFVLFNNVMEVFKLSFQDDLDKFIIRISIGKIQIICENLSVWNFSQ